jgi:membrane-associated PAP2 superfamily phosphatase
VTILGWILGFYQILKGAHFVSDTILAMLLCLLLAQIIAKIYRQKIINK